ncbi:helix-turn-helix domain-containing protein [Leptospira fluminis]|uniref:helix-turn-helix domain-containing protein n=1 Tax=Leptospira fluminis TaxID=2484979 RepID=UPI001AEFF0B4|nr:helix-turn-helix domain-containing protein [Leptospira fluminis]
MSQVIKIQPVVSKSDYHSAMKRIEVLMDSENKSKTEDLELETLFILVENYEEEHFPFPSADPIEAIKFRMEQEGLSQTDLAKILGSKNRASEYLNRKIPLSIHAMRKIKEALGISGDILLQKYLTKK